MNTAGIVTGIVAATVAGVVMWSPKEETLSTTTPMTGKFVSGHPMDFDDQGIRMDSTVFLGPIVTHPEDGSAARVILAFVELQFGAQELMSAKWYKFPEPSSRTPISNDFLLNASAAEALAGRDLEDRVYTLKISPAEGLEWGEVKAFEDLQFDW